MLRPPAEFRESLECARSMREADKQGLGRVLPVTRQLIRMEREDERAMLAERRALRAKEPGIPVRTHCVWCPSVHLIRAGKLLSDGRGNFGPSSGLCEKAYREALAAIKVTA